MANEKGTSGPWFYASPAPVFAVLPLGIIDDHALKRLAEIFKRVFGGIMRELPAVQTASLMPAFNRERAQFNADRLIRLLHWHLPDDAAAIIGVTQEDLYAPERTFVYGYAHILNRTTVYSTRRFDDSFWGPKISHQKTKEEREFAIVIHELGHVFGVERHCHDSAQCVMRAVGYLREGNIPDLDLLNPAYCSQCAEKIQQTLAKTSIK